MQTDHQHKLNSRPKPTVYHTTPYRDGCTNQREYTETYKDQSGNKGIKTLCDYTNAKGKEVLGYFLRIKWDD